VTGEPRYLFTADDRDALARLLAGVPPTHLAAVAGDLFAPGQFPAGLRWSDTAAVVDRIATMEVVPDGVPPLLLFAARVAAELSDDLAQEIDGWLDATARAARVDREALGPRAAQLPAGDALDREGPSPGVSAPSAVVGAGSSDAPFVQVAAYVEKSGHNRPGQPSSSERPGIVTGRSESAVLEPTGAPGESDGRVRIWGRVPLRNPAFTGRETLLLTLQRALERRSKASVLPHALHGLGGVGKTQLAVEFAYRYADRYDIVWWIPAEHQSLVLQSLYQLGRHLDVPDTAELQQGASLVLERLADSPLRWLLIYDNANEPEEIARLMPPRGGHVILTSRNPTWSEVWDPIEVDIFDRPESIELVRKRSEDVSERDADRLAARLGDLPLALDQAASCQAATGISVTDYLTELEEHVRELSKDDRPTYRTTIAALVRFALRHLRANAPAVAELLEMFAYLGAEPVSGGLLRRGRQARVTGALGRALRDPIAWDRAVRDLRRYGLAKIDPDQRIHVHRLFQGVLRDKLSEDAARRGRSNVHHLLASANPGYPNDEATWPVHAEIGPHILPAGLLDSDLLDARRVVLDQVRYLLLIGDVEGSRRMGEAAVDAWSKVEDTPGLGPDGGLTLSCATELSRALRQLGFNDRARDLGDKTLERLRESPEFGPDHEYTLAASDAVAVNLRVAGRFVEAFRLDDDVLTRCRRTFGEEDETTLKARSNLAVNLRMLSDFNGAYAIDSEVVGAWQQVVSENDNRLLFAQANLARDLYGLGRYADALSLLRKILPPYRQQLGARHPHVLLAGRTLAITLRKVGRYEEALVTAAEHHHDSTSRYGAPHEHALAAAITHANALRVTGDLPGAHRLTSEATDRYLRVFGESHPLTMAAFVNHAIVLRGLGELDRARALDERMYALMEEKLGPEHGYRLCAASGLANDLALAGEVEAVRRLSEETLEASRRVRGERHPYTLSCAVNAALDLIAARAEGEGRARLHDAVNAFEAALGAEHPETAAAGEGQRAESDIEPPPT
jgi:tetratricopeptide (TPR) repeat protein